MQLFGPTGSRSEFRDRNPTPIHSSFDSSITGGSAPVVTTYTVPANRRALIESAYVSYLITTALAAAQTLVLTIRVTVPVPITVVAWLDSGPGAAGPDDDHATAGQVSLSADQAIEARATIGAGAGVVLVRAGLHGVEYDA